MRSDLVIGNWMRDVFRSPLLQPNEIHIDRIDPSLRNRDMWISGGLEVLSTAPWNTSYDKTKGIVALVCSLKGGSELIHPKFRSQRDLELALDQTPPSLSVFRQGKEPWNVPDQKMLREPLNLVLPGIESTFLLQFRHPSVDGYCRTVCLT